MLVVSSRELFFFALFRAFVGVVRDVSSNKGQTLISGKGLHFFAVVLREKKKKGFFAFVRRTLLILRTL